MGILFILAAVSFAVLFLINLGWLISNLYLVIIDGFSAILTGSNFAENIIYSTYLKWIILADVVWLIILFSFMIKRNQYKTDPELHYLDHKQIEKPNICLVIPAYNEEKSIENVILDYQKQRHVNEILIIDNNSTDNTVSIAEKCNVKVIKKSQNLGFGHSFVLGLKEALKTNANIIATTEADGSFNAYDLKKMLPYLDNCDMVIGTRQNQILTQKGNQNSLLHVWGNFWLAKLIQIKYFSLLHAGIVNLTDVGCVFRVLRKDGLEKVIDQLTFENSDTPKADMAAAIHLTLVGIENDLRILEIPVTFNRRIGDSKIKSNTMTRGIKICLDFLWFILKN